MDPKKARQAAHYQSIAKTTKISCISRCSVKIKDTFYTFEYGEERSIDPMDLRSGRVNLDQEREVLWTECHAEVDRQVQEVLNMGK